MIQILGWIALTTIMVSIIICFLWCGGGDKNNKYLDYGKF